MSRALAKASRDGYLTVWREHQPTCPECKTAAERADAEGTRPIYKVCAVGYSPLMLASQIEIGLRAGWYPDRDQAAPVAARAIQGELFDPAADEQTALP